VENSARHLAALQDTCKTVFTDREVKSMALYEIELKIKLNKTMTSVGFEPTPMKTTALSNHDTATKQSNYFVVYQETENDKHTFGRRLLGTNGIELEGEVSLKSLREAIQAAHPKTFGELDSAQLHLYKPWARKEDATLNYQLMVEDDEDVKQSKKRGGPGPLIVIAPKPHRSSTCYLSSSLDGEN